MRTRATAVVLAAILAPVTVAGQSYAGASVGVRLFDGAAPGLGLRYVSTPVFPIYSPGVTYGLGQRSLFDRWCPYPGAYAFGCRRSGLGVSFSVGFSLGVRTHHHWAPWYADPWYLDFWDPWHGDLWYGDLRAPDYVVFGFGSGGWWTGHRWWRHDPFWRPAPWWYASAWYGPGWYAPTAFASRVPPARRIRSFRRAVAARAPGAPRGPVFKESPRRVAAVPVRPSGRLSAAAGTGRPSAPASPSRRPAVRDRSRTPELRTPSAALRARQSGSRSPMIRTNAARRPVPRSPGSASGLRTPTRRVRPDRPAAPRARALPPPRARSDVRRPRAGGRPPSVRSAPRSRSSPPRRPTRRGGPPPPRRRGGG